MFKDLIESKKPQLRLLLVLIKPGIGPGSCRRSSNVKLMTRVTLTVLLAVFAVSTVFAVDRSPGVYVVITGQLNVRLAPNRTGKIAAILKQGEKVEVFEFNGYWARISEYFDGTSEGLSGEVARWTSAKEHLLAKLPVDGKIEEKKEVKVEVKVEEKIIVNPAIARAIKSSDDLEKYQNRFMVVSDKLINSGTCKLSDFEDIGGWWRSPEHQPRPVYYTYCGGGSNSDRIYFNATTRKVFR